MSKACLLIGMLLIAGCASDLSPYLGDPDDARRVEPLELTTRPAKTATTQPTTQPAGRTVELTLSAARRIALANNTNVGIAEIDPQIAAAGLSVEQGAFEATFGVDARYAKQDSPFINQTIFSPDGSGDTSVVRVQGGQLDALTIDPSLTKPLRTGGQVRVTAPIDRVETDQGRLLNPQWEQDVRVSISQPLLRGFGSDASELGIRIAATEVAAARQRLKVTVVDTIAAVDRAYWQLWSARRAVEVREEQLQLVGEQLERAQRRFRAGSTGELEVVRAESAQADATEELVAAVGQADRAQRALRDLMSVRLESSPFAVGNSSALEPSTKAAAVPYSLEPRKLVTMAMQRRGELAEARVAELAEQARLLNASREAYLPRLDVFYEWGVNGLGGDYDGAVDQLGSGDFQDQTIGLTFEQPLGNRVRRQQLRQSLLRRAQRLLDVRRRQEIIKREVYDACEGIDTGYERILAARQRVATAERLLAAEERQVDAGATSSAELLESQRNLASARLSLASAISQYEIARVDLAAATGTVLGKAGVVLE
ncbi:MAG: TolC family protein [Planctomycetota bacterium]